MAGKLWLNSWVKVGGPDAVYKDGQIWRTNGSTIPVGAPNAAYDGDDDGAAAAFAALKLLS